ncbi:MAG: type II and III secretion system protein family protein [Rhizomicrobium sp.]
MRILSAGLFIILMAVPSWAGTAQVLSPQAAPSVLRVESSEGGVHERIRLSLHKAELVHLSQNARDVLVSNPDIVDAVVKGPRRIILLAKKIGQTNAFFFDAAGHQLLSIDIRVERDVTPLSDMLRADMPGSNIHVATLNDNLVLTGDVENAVQATRADALAARFVGDPKKVVNMLNIGGGEQVMLRVRIAEVQRAVAKQLGIDLAGAVVAGGVPIGVSTSNPYGLVGQALSDLSGFQAGQVCSAASSAINPLQALQGGGVCQIRNNIQGTLKALETVGLVHTLAEPNLTAVSGQTAQFLAGGEFPVPAGRDLEGNVTVVFKKFGVGLSFTPVVLSPHRISLQISTEVSELTNTGSFTLTGTTPGSNLTIPALSVRRAQTTVDLPSGGSFAIAGLLQHTTKQQIDAFPGLKDMPVLGALFRSRDFQNNETELVVMVTPYLVNPVAPDKIALPTDGYRPATDAQTILLGKLNQAHQKVTPRLVRQADHRFIVE